MVKVISADGSVFHQPPYTRLEQRDVERRSSAVVRFSRFAPRRGLIRTAAEDAGVGLER